MKFSKDRIMEMMAMLGKMLADHDDDEPKAAAVPAKPLETPPRVVPVAPAPTIPTPVEVPIQVPTPAIAPAAVLPIPIVLQLKIPPANPIYAEDINHLLVHARTYGNARVDPVVGPDCPNTVTLPKTGHTLSLPRTDLGEMFMGYATRVADQATGGNGNQYLSGIGAMFLGTGTYFERAGGGPFNPDGSNWPGAADCYFNMRAYMSPEEKAKDDSSKQGWAEYDEKIKARVAAERAAAVAAAQAVPPIPAVPEPALPTGETPL